MQIAAQLKVQTRDWNSKQRYRVTEVVQHRNIYWANATGSNAEPGTGSEWLLLGEAEPYYKGLKITKSLENTGRGLEALDEVRGFWSTELFITAFFIGGDKDDISNYDVQQETPLS